MFEVSMLQSVDGNGAEAMEITVPDGCGPGDTLSIEARDEEHVEVIVPDGLVRYGGIQVLLDV